jgi:phosphoglycolate phosphatase-like HAD superfamily hydrolase
MSHRPRLNIDAIVFACYDILIDVRYSYRDVVRQTVQLYLERALGLTPSKEALLTANDVALLQKVGRFASYWDLTEAFAMYFVELLPPVPVPTFPAKLSVPALSAYLQFACGNLSISLDDLRQKKDSAELARDVAAHGGGVDGAHKALPTENRHALVAVGEITKTNILRRIFQELYLGADIFERVYDEQAVIIQSTGFAEHESPIIDPQVLQSLSESLPLAVVSDRPRREVERSLKASKIDGYFQCLITLDEIKSAKAGPVPNPWPLLTAAGCLQPTPARTAYVGGSVDDICAANLAAQTAPFTGIACLVGAYDADWQRAEFEENRASVILGHPNHLLELILGTQTRNRNP